MRGSIRTGFGALLLILGSGLFMGADDCGGERTTTEGCAVDDDCADGELCAEGMCIEAAVDDCVCTEIYDPVCGSDGQSYANPCFAGCEGVDVTHNGVCWLSCSPVDCELGCPNGFGLDEEGCEICECAPPVLCHDDADCGETAYCSYDVCHSGCGLDDEACPAVCYGECRGEPQGCEPLACRLDCPNGLAHDDAGCDVCACAEPQRCLNNLECSDRQYCDLDVCYAACDDPSDPCSTMCFGVCGDRPDHCEPLPCDVWCEFGHVLDDAGCETCACLPSPLCITDAECAEGERCDRSDCHTRCEVDGSVEGCDRDCFGNCAPDCGADTDCDDGWVCIDNVCERSDVCEPLLCDVWCEFGHVFDDAGCETCACLPGPECRSHDDCPGDLVCVEGRCNDPSGCDPVACDIWCPFGHVLAEAGCETCECLPGGCEDNRQCERGFVCLEGMCSPPCIIDCFQYDPVCGTDGRTYGCGIEDAWCHGVDVVYEGECRHSCEHNGHCDDGLVCIEGECSPPCEIACLRYDPVCGTDGNTYGCGAADASCHGVEVAYEGECRQACRSNSDCRDGLVCLDGQCSPPCEIACFVYDPVCGTDGVTYACGAEDAWCHGIEVAYEGECEASCICTAEYAPVCGVNGETYSNACQAECAGVEIAYRGPCECTPVLCEIACPFGWAVDERGCEICACADPPAGVFLIYVGWSFQGYGSECPEGTTEAYRDGGTLVCHQCETRGDCNGEVCEMVCGPGCENDTGGCCGVTVCSPR